MHRGGQSLATRAATNFSPENTVVPVNNNFFSQTSFPANSVAPKRLLDMPPKLNADSGAPSRAGFKSGVPNLNLDQVQPRSHTLMKNEKPGPIRET